MSPYAVSKVAAFHACSYYKRVYNIQMATAISFNHESPLRGAQFVTSKIVMHAVLQSTMQSVTPLQLGNLEAVRDWGHAADYCVAYQLMLAKLEEQPCKEMMTYVVATDHCCSVRGFVVKVYKELGY